jgi:hypothetical protein
VLELKSVARWSASVVTEDSGIKILFGFGCERHLQESVFRHLDRREVRRYPCPRTRFETTDCLGVALPRIADTGNASGQIAPDVKSLPVRIHKVDVVGLDKCTNFWDYFEVEFFALVVSPPGTRDRIYEKFRGLAL